MDKFTSEAWRLRESLKILGLNVEEEHYDGHKHVDLYLKDSKIYIEVDGPRHLTDAHQLVRDLKRDHFSHRDGYDTIHVPNESINSDSKLSAVACAINEAASIKLEWLRHKS